MSCETYIYEINYSQMDISLRYIDTINSYDLLDYLPVEIVAANNGYFEIEGELLIKAIQDCFKDKDLSDSLTDLLSYEKYYMIGVSY